MASASTQPRTRLHIGGLPRELLDDELRARFAPFGEVRSVEVLREKPESPFFPWEDEGSGGEDSESDSEVGIRGGRGGRGGLGGRGGRSGQKRPPRPPPCRGFAYVDLRPADAKSLNRCITLYNGCKWKGGVLSVREARPRFLERLKMERDGVDERGNSLKGTKAHGASEDVAGVSKGENVRAPLKVGDELEIAGRARHETARVRLGEGSKSHKRGAAEFPEPSDLDTDDDDGVSPWRSFEPSASHATLRRLGQLPEIERAAKARAAAEEARFEKRRARMFARLGKDTTSYDFEEACLDEDSSDHHRGLTSEPETSGANSGGSVSSDPGGSAAVGAKKETADAGKDRRFALPRAFFSSAAAAERATDRAGARRTGDAAVGELVGAKSARERYGLGPVARDERETERKRGRRDESAEMRALAAFLGGSDDEEDDENDATADDGGATADTKPPAVANRPGTAVGAVKAPGCTARPRPRDPDEGGVPAARTGAKWWEAGGGGADGETSSRADGHASAPTRIETSPGPIFRDGKTSSRATASTDGLARDFFRAGAPFAPFGTRRGRRANERDAARDGSEGDGSEGDDSVSERALLRDWRGEDDESENDEPDVVDFD